MTEIVIPTGAGGNGFAYLSLVPGYPYDGYVSVYEGLSEADKRGVCATRENFLNGVAEAFDVTIAPKKGVFETDERTSGIQRDTSELFIGYQITEYWQLVRAEKHNAVLLDKDGTVWAYEFDEEEGASAWAPAVHDAEPQDSPESLYITDCFPATVIYIRGQR